MGFLDSSNLTRTVRDLRTKFAAITHSHAASDITSGTLGTARGGTGVTSNPSMLANLGSTSSDTVFKTSPRPGVTGTLAISNGGTGATTAAAARTNLDAAQSNGASGTLKSAETEIDNLESSLAYVESTTARTNHAVGDYFMLGNVLMKATAAIATGEQITSSKATPVTVQSQIDTLRDSVFRHRGLATDTDLNSTMYYALGCWSLTSLSYTNIPSETNAHWGTLVTFVTSANAPLSQMIITPSDHPGRIYVRRYGGNAWVSWHVIVGNVNA